MATLRAGGVAKPLSRPGPFRWGELKALESKSLGNKG